VIYGLDGERMDHAIGNACNSCCARTDWLHTGTAFSIRPKQRRNDPPTGTCCTPAAWVGLSDRDSACRQAMTGDRVGTSIRSRIGVARGARNPYEMHAHLARASFVAARMQLERARPPQALALLGIPALLSQIMEKSSLRTNDRGVDGFICVAAENRIALRDARADALLRDAIANGDQDDTRVSVVSGPQCGLRVDCAVVPIRVRRATYFSAGRHVDVNTRDQAGGSVGRTSKIPF